MLKPCRVQTRPFLFIFFRSRQSPFNYISYVLSQLSLSVSVRSLLKIGTVVFIANKLREKINNGQKRTI